jgi:Bacterial cell division membrane protein
MFNLKQYDWKRYNGSLVIVVIILCCLSAYLVKLAGGETDGASFFKKQLMGLVLGLFIVAIISIIDYHFICRFVMIYYIIGTLLVAATIIPGIGTDLQTGSYRWINLGFTNLQPSELCKIILILTFAVLFTNLRDKMDRISTLLIGLLLLAIPVGIILKQSNLSSALVMMFIFSMMIFAAGISYKIILPILAVGLPSSLVLFWYIQQPYQKLLNKYQANRILGFLNPEENASGIMFQQNHSVDAIASGRIYGKLILDNTGVRNYKYVDVRESDFIFSVIGEELGFIGSCVIIALLAFIIIKCVVAARKARDFTGMLIAIGIASMFMFQVFANIGVATSILPNTGLPLPFLSYGLSSMLSSMISIGLIINIGLQAVKSPYNSTFTVH